MSKYTTEVRFICETACGLVESVGLSRVDEVLEGSVDKVFDFQFPIFDESYRKILEKKILRHYYTREISAETVGLWKLWLSTRLNEIMPNYNKLYEAELAIINPLYTVDMTTKRDNKRNDNRTGNENINDTTKIKSDGTGSGTSSATTNSSNTNAYSDTPQGSLSGVDELTYLTNASKDTSEATTSNTSSTSTHDESENTFGRVRNDSDSLNSVEDYLEHVYGFNGNKISAELLKRYKDVMINIDLMVINDLEDLFFQLW